MTRVAANYVVYAGIALSGYVGTSDFCPTSVRFLAGAVLATLTAVKALMSKGGEPQDPQPVVVTNSTSDPVPTDPQG